MAAGKRDESGAYFKQSQTALSGIFIPCAIGATCVARNFLVPVVLATFIAPVFRPTIRRLTRYIEGLTV